MRLNDGRRSKKYRWDRQRQSEARNRSMGGGTSDIRPSTSAYPHSSRSPLITYQISTRSVTSRR